MKSAEQGQSQSNLWLYLTEIGPGQQSLTGSIDQGYTWIKGVEAILEQSCSPLRLLFDQEKVKPFEILITTYLNASAEEESIESATPVPGVFQYLQNAYGPSIHLRKS
ncbi:MAG: hypothetical protein AAGI25_12800 [Bacteroidota bacterium]